MSLNKSIKLNCENNFNIKIEDSIQIKKGWLNKKWKIIANGKFYLIKQFSLQRYNTNQINNIEIALEKQAQLYEFGINSPKIYKLGKQIIQKTDQNEYYMLMDFCDGVHHFDTISSLEIENLGKMCSLMHKVSESFNYKLNDFIFFNTKETLYNHYKENLEYLTNTNSEQFHSLIKQQEKIINSIDDDFYKNLHKGFTHSDFASDNILFKHNIPIILDFDRSVFSYQFQDIGRAILSFTFNGNSLDQSLIDSFLKGYNIYKELKKEDIATALKLIWIIETTWWIKKEHFIDNIHIKIKRFRDELTWVSFNWFELNKMIK